MSDVSIDTYFVKICCLIVGNKKEKLYNYHACDNVTNVQVSRIKSDQIIGVKPTNVVMSNASQCC